MAGCAMRDRPQRCPFGFPRSLEHALNGNSFVSGHKVRGSRSLDAHGNGVDAAEAPRGPAMARKRRSGTHWYLVSQNYFKICHTCSSCHSHGEMMHTQAASDMAHAGGISHPSCRVCCKRGRLLAHTRRFSSPHAKEMVSKAAEAAFQLGLHIGQ